MDSYEETPPIMATHLKVRETFILLLKRGYEGGGRKEGERRKMCSSITTIKKEKIKEGQIVI